MKVISKEFHEVMQDFERAVEGYRLERELRIDFHRKIYYQDGTTNKLFQMFLLGYSLAKSKAISGDLILENN